MYLANTMTGRGPRGAVLARRRPRPGSARGRGGPRGRRRRADAAPRSSSTTGPPRASHAAPGPRVTLDYFLWHEEGRLETARAEFQRRSRSRRWPASPPTATSCPTTPASPSRSTSPTGIPPSRSTSIASGPRTRPTGTATARRRRPSCPSPWASGSGDTARGGSPPCGSRPRRARRSRTPGGASRRALLAELRRGEAGPGRDLGARRPSRRSVAPRSKPRAARPTSASTSRTSPSSWSLAGLLLAGLFFRLGLEQRLREVGLLEALGFTAARLRRHYLAEGLALAGRRRRSSARSPLRATPPSCSGACARSGRTPSAPATSSFTLRPWSPLLGALGAVARGGPRRGVDAPRPAPAVSPRAPRGLARAVDGSAGPPALRRRAGPRRRAALALAAASRLGVAPRHRRLLRRRVAPAGRRPPPRAPARGPAAPASALAVRGIAGLGLRGLSFRPGRSVLCVALVAAATFVIVAVGAFRHEGARRRRRPGTARAAATGSSPGPSRRCTTTSRAPRARPPSASRRGTSTASGVARFRARRGDDASCLNLYAPREPTVLAATPSFLRERSLLVPVLAGGDGRGAREPVAPARARAAARRGHPGRRRRQHARLRPPPQARRRDAARRDGRPRALRGGPRPGRPARRARHGRAPLPRCVPRRDGRPLLPLRRPRGPGGRAVHEARVAPLRLRLRRRRDRGAARATSTASRTRTSRRSRPWALSAFSSGSVGLATVLVRNALEQRGELALLRAVGYRPRHLARMALAQNGALVGLGFLAGAVPALVAVVPTLLDRRGAVPLALAAGPAPRPGRDRPPRLLAGGRVRAAAAAHRLAALRVKGSTMPRTTASSPSSSSPPPPAPPTGPSGGARRGTAGRPWPPAPTLPETLTPAWKVAVGEGHASPVVVGDRVYVFSREGEEEVLQALDLATGQRRLARDLPRAVHDEPRGHRPRQGAEVDARRRRRPRLHVRDRRDPLRLRRRHRPARLAEGAGRRVRPDLPALRRRPVARRRRAAA